MTAVLDAAAVPAPRPPVSHISAPSHTTAPAPASGSTTFPGGVRVLGGALLLIPGRTLDPTQLDEARQHARSVLAAIELLAGPEPCRWCDEVLEPDAVLCGGCGSRTS